MILRRTPVKYRKLTPCCKAIKPSQRGGSCKYWGATSPIDAGVSYELANRIESIWNTDKASNHLANDNERLRAQV